jgi:hypothetical protein
LANEKRNIDKIENPKIDIIRIAGEKKYTIFLNIVSFIKTLFI